MTEEERIDEQERIEAQLKNERSTEAELEPEPGLEPEAVAALEPETEPEPKPEAHDLLSEGQVAGVPPVMVNVKVQIPVASNDALKQLAEYWHETKQESATDLLMGSIQYHYAICKAHKRF